MTHSPSVSSLSSVSSSNEIPSGSVNFVAYSSDYQPNCLSLSTSLTIREGNAFCGPNNLFGGVGGYSSATGFICFFKALC